MWGGRFAEGPAAVMREINASIPFDKRLWKQDIAGSRAHVTMLAKQGIVPQATADAILGGLDSIEADYTANGVPEDLTLEDIHMTVESRLAELIGPEAGRLHTARSRNDQVATDFRLWVRDAMDEVDQALALLQKVLVARAEEHVDSIMPGFTHLQVAQPVTLGHHLMAYYEMIARDRSRFADARKRMNFVPWAVQRWRAQASRLTVMPLRRRLALMDRLPTASIAFRIATLHSITCRRLRNVHCTCHDWRRNLLSGQRRCSAL